MKSTALWGLIVVNVALAISLGARIFHQPTAMGQAAMPGAPAGLRNVGDYLAIPANFTGTSSGVVIVVDQTSEQLSALTYDDSNKRFSAMQKVDLKPLFAAGMSNNARPR